MRIVSVLNYVILNTNEEIHFYTNDNDMFGFVESIFVISLAQAVALKQV